MAEVREVSMLVRVPEELEQAVRESASRQGVPLNTWWIEAAQQRVERETVDLAAVAGRMNADPKYRDLLDRLAR